MWESLMGMFGGMGGGAGAMLGGGGMTPGADAGIFGRISQIAPEWDPFPILNQMNAPQPGLDASVKPAGGWDWMNPQGVSHAGPVDMSRIQSGPLAGAPGQLPVPAAASAGMTPLSAAQQAALRGMAPQAPDPSQVRFAPSGGIPSGGRQIAFNPVTLPAAAGASAVPGLAQILGRR